MDLSDHHLCANCGEAAFYDATITDPAYLAMSDETETTAPLAVLALCPACAKTHELIVVRRETDDEEIGTCESCSRRVAAGEPHTFGSDHEVLLCGKCSPTWQDLQSDPETFAILDELLTREQADRAVAHHLAGGGKLTDSMATPSGMADLKIEVDQA
ncbi:hypothetical protein KM176_16405 [Pseudooceanicola sp. CBS1P-1]|uniref:Uncharacterized protein n=1 Tax=Pseudooceanicola albus TaxID=2692189 RepID=A0A6L7G543_9RHOB|nr:MULTISPECIES: hypothetical protein [Pseudooceanicola]MBT9385457.1 hypothetical protein [Pseudooceanicola endophyticus]MXN19131.1 hypothetical protein [Pseudooceanicola albus]